MDQQHITVDTIRRRVAERYPMYTENPGFEQWLEHRTGKDMDEVDRYLDLLDSYGYMTGDGTLAEDYVAMPDPASVATELNRQLQGLHPDIVDLLNAASVEGTRFSNEVLAHLLPERSDIDAALELAIRAGVVRRERHESEVPLLSYDYRFVPTQTRDILYTRLQDQERARLHGSIVDYLGTMMEKAGDKATRDMLFELIHEHNDLASRPSPTSPSE